MSTERIIVSEAIIERFSARLSQLASEFNVHPGASVTGTSKVVKLIEDALSKGARSLSGEKPQQQGALLRPIVLTGVTRDMDIWHTETFGPVTILVPFHSINEAVNLANDSAYGLAAGIFTNNIPLAIALARRIDCGGVHINSATIHDEAHLPHGGTKDSGWGRFGVPWGEINEHSYVLSIRSDLAPGFSEFTQLKTITIADDNFLDE